MRGGTAQVRVIVFRKWCESWKAAMIEKGWLGE
jgi:hypothetical protein